MASGTIGGHRPRWVVMAVVVMTALTVMTGCGASDYIYVANSDEKTYVRIPGHWRQVDQTEIDDFFMSENPDSATGQLRKQLQWSTAYDGDTVDPDAEHLISLGVIREPIVYLSVRHLPEQEQAMVSYDFMRNIFLPVTAAVRSQLGADSQLVAFENLYDEVLPSGEDGLHGVRTIFNYETARTGLVHTFDQTVYANADSSIIYLLLVHCTARCYRDRAVEIDDIATSFTVRTSP